MFYTYRQNNTGGYYIEPAVTVVVEAGSPEEADRLAQAHGLYFDGVGDCDCCGNRWTSWVGKAAWGEEPEATVPEIDPWWTDRGVPDQLVVRKATALTPIPLPPAPVRRAIEA